jgi:hypothetical protein
MKKKTINKSMKLLAPIVMGLLGCDVAWYIGRNILKECIVSMFRVEPH